MSLRHGVKLSELRSVGLPLGARGPRLSVSETDTCHKRDASYHSEGSSNLTLYTMYGRSQQAYRWDVPQENDRTQRIDLFSNSRCVVAAFTASPIAYMSYILAYRQHYSPPAPQVCICISFSLTSTLDVYILNSCCTNTPVSLSQTTPPLWVELAL